MNRLQAALSLFSVAAITGCSGFGASSFPDASANPAQIPVGTIQGSVYGGHAPLVGAHVYLLEPGTTGYGSQATSLLCNGGTNSSCTTQLTANPATGGDTGIPTGWYHTNTDSTGAFSITGDYACTAGNPVYLYAYAGSPTYPVASNVFSISSINVESRIGLFSKTYTVLFTVDPAVTPVENFYVGEPITLSGFSGNYSFLNGNVGYVAGNSNLSTTSFELSTSVANASAATPTLQTYTSTGATLALGAQSVGTDGIATATPDPGTPIGNTGVVNLATLGVCPSTGSLAAGGTLFNGSTSSPIKFIYLNEVSTVATAYAFEGFTPATVTTNNNNATYIGSSSTNLIGIENAALNAALLYDINGSQITTAYAGEGHIANPKTPAGNGLVPQNLLNTLGNILAACVDSNNTSAGASPQCNTLFNTATISGVAGATPLPLDTGQAAINIAKHPAGSIASTATFMSTLYSLPTSNVPFTPHLTAQPNDFTVAISYPFAFTANAAISSATTLTTNPTANGPESIAVDSFGNIWMNDLTPTTSPSTYYPIFEMTPQGVVAYTNTANTLPVGYITIDPSNNLFTGNNNRLSGEYEIAASGSVNTGTTRTTYTYNGAYGGTNFTANNFWDSYMSVATSTGNILIGAAPPTTTAGTTPGATWYTAGLNPATPGTFASLFNPVSDGAIAGSKIAHGVTENATATNGAGDVWWTNETDPGATNAFSIVRADPTTGAVAFTLQYNAAAGGNNLNLIVAPEMPAIDNAGNLWTATQGNGGLTGNHLLEVSPTGTITDRTGGITTLNAPFGVSIDGSNHVFVANRGGGAGKSIAEYDATNNVWISPTSNFYTLSGQLTGPLNIAVDQSGNLWIAAYEGNEIVQWIGAGTPAPNPLSLASKNKKLGTTP